MELAPDIELEPNPAAPFLEQQAQVSMAAYMQHGTEPGPDILAYVAEHPDVLLEAVAATDVPDVQAAADRGIRGRRLNVETLRWALLNPTLVTLDLGGFGKTTFVVNSSATIPT